MLQVGPPNKMDNPYRKPYKIEVPRQPPKITTIDVSSSLQRWKDKRFRYWTLLIAASINIAISIWYWIPPFLTLFIFLSFYLWNIQGKGQKNKRYCFTETKQGNLV